MIRNLPHRRNKCCM